MHALILTKHLYIPAPAPPPLPLAIFLTDALTDIWMDVCMCVQVWVADSGVL